MAVQDILKLNLKKIIRHVKNIVEKNLEVPLPNKVIEIAIEPELDILFIRFNKPEKTETGEPLEPNIHIFTDSQKITALEIHNLKNFLQNLTKPQNNKPI